MHRFYTIKKTSIAFFLLFTAWGSVSCDESRVHENIKVLPNEGWDYQDAKSFEVPVQDESQAYHLSLAVRNSIDYPYYNLYLKYNLFDPSGKLVKGGMIEANLMDPKTGVPNGQSGKATGQGSGLYYSHLLPVLTNHVFTETGTYQLEVKHYMRPDTLRNILAVGVTLDKVMER